MVKRVVLVAAMMVWAVGSVALGQSSLTGDWEMKLLTQTGETMWQAHFEQDGSTIGGEINIGDREILPVNGSLDGTTLTFTIVVPDLDGDQPISFEGEVAGDTIQGADGTFSWYGTGNWVASRQ